MNEPTDKNKPTKRKSKKDSLVPALIISGGLHVLLVIVLLWGADFSSDATPTPKSGRTIDATVIDPAVVSAQAKKIREQRDQAKREEAERLKRLEQQAKRLEQQREQEEQRLREVKRQKLEAERQAREEQKRIAEQKAKSEEQARIAKQQAEQAERDRQRKLEEKRQAELAAQKAEKARQEKLAAQRKAEKKAEAERQRKLAEKRKAEEQALKEAEQARKKAEQARKEAERRAEEAKRQQQEQEAALNDLFSGLESEASQRQSARGQFIQDEVARYGAIFTQMIQQRLIVDDGLSGQECVVNMRLSPTGLLLNVEEKAGNTRLCRATKTAVASVSQFPMPEDGDIIAKLRDIELTVRPN
ncbi:cell envelope integrity protein TolA [Salinivibrio sp. ES.052]|uniref:cell envelope integrity protein TolA n=1 Tax=Salinivibrio sp. ES.052 TaxID=1882823 RepID=UPI000927ED60|nr:cell envelope integrity protein TolA [Salinivibrio sp. ES.052]SIN78947.1 Cell division and transport-associated protein TolA [Salinivibrio sp. ES.052]